MPSYSEVPTMDPKTGTITWVGDEPQRRDAQTRFGVQSLRLKWTEDLFDVACGLNGKSSAGVSTETNDYLRRAFEDVEEVETMLLPFGNVLLAGHLSEEAVARLRMTRLVVIPKDGGAHRPLGVGRSPSSVSTTCTRSAVAYTNRLHAVRWPLVP